MSYIQNAELDWTNWKTLQASAAFGSSTVFYLQNDLQYVPFWVQTNGSPDLAEFVYYVNVNRDPSSVSGPYAALSSGVKASRDVESSITYTANSYGTGGNSITITYANDAVSVGKEFATVSGTAITVHIVSGSSTAQQVQAAVNGWNAYTGLSQYNSAASAELVSAVIDTGKEGTKQTTTGPLALTGGTAAVTVLADWTANFLGSATKVGSFMDGVAQQVS